MVRDIGGPKYSLDQWNEHRQMMAEYVSNVQQQYEQDVNEAAASDIVAPPAPQLPPPPPELPPSFVQELMPELQWENDYAKALTFIHKSYKATLEWLKELRRPKEVMWAEAEDSYNSVEELSYDENRNKSVKTLANMNMNGEDSPERMSLILPFAFDSCQLIGAHLYRLMRGVGTQYCEITGQEPNDNPDAIRTENFMNYQFSHEIPTEDVLSDLVHDATVLGTGVLLQTWDAKHNTRHLTVLRRQNVWWDKAPSLSECNVINVRMEVSVGDLYDMRQNGQVWFEDDDMKAAARRHVVEEYRSNYGDSLQPEMSFSTAHKTLNEDIDTKYQKVYLDIMMHTEPAERWVYVVNEDLVVAVKQPMIPNSPDVDIEYRAPLTVFAPIRRRGEIDGDSFVARILDVQDMSNAALELMISNMKATTEGIGLTKDETLIGSPVKIGKWNDADPNQSTILYPKSNSGEILSVIDWLTSRVTDKITGATPEFRGQQQFAGATATGMRDMMAQSAQRINPMEDRVLASMQDTYEVGITLNRLYLAPHKFYRIVGEQGLPERAMQGAQTGQAGPISSVYIIGCSGKDLIPTGFPGSASDVAQKAMNYAIPIMQAGGNPQPLMKEAVRVEFRGRIDPNAIFPANGVGHNPYQENDMLMQGQTIRRDPDDGPYDMMHVQIHMAMEQDPRWLQMIQQNPMLDIPRQEHIAAHMQFLQQQAAMQSGAMGGGSSGGFGSGSGLPGQNNTPVQAQPKKDSEREAQMRELDAKK